MQLSADLHIVDLVVEMDAKVAIDLITNCHQDFQSSISLLNDCRYLMQQLQVTKIDHIFREAIQCADALAGLGCCNFNSSLSLYDSIPSCINHVIAKDVVGTSFPRLI